MTRKTATAAKDAQPDLLGGDRGLNATVGAVSAGSAKAKPVAKAAAKTQLAVVQGGTDNLLDSLRRIASLKSGDVAVAKEVLAMIREQEERRAQREFNEAMLACQSDLPPITRDSHNKHTNSKWAKLEKISAIADPIIRRHKFTLSYGMATSPLADHYRVVCDVSHSGGHTRRYEADVGMDSKGPKGEGNKSLAQGSGSSITYARRYLKVMIFDIVIEGEDNDGNRSRPSSSSAANDRVIDGGGAVEGTALLSEAQHDKLVDAIESCGATRQQFCASWEIAKVADLAAEHFDRAMAACAKRAKDRK